MLQRTLLNSVLWLLHVDMGQNKPVLSHKIRLSPNWRPWTILAREPKIEANHWSLNGSLVPPVCILLLFCLSLGKMGSAGAASFLFSRELHRSVVLDLDGPQETGCFLYPTRLHFPTRLRPFSESLAPPVIDPKLIDPGGKENAHRPCGRGSKSEPLALGAPEKKLPAHGISRNPPRF